MLNIEYCQHCLDEMEDFGEIVTSMYSDICNVYAAKKIPIRFRTELDSEVSYALNVIYLLERKGYIKTADAEGDLIQIIPVGHSEIEGCTPIHCFCAKNHSRFC